MENTQSATIFSLYDPFPLETKFSYIARLMKDIDVSSQYPDVKRRRNVIVRKWEDFKNDALVVINTTMESEYFIRENDGIRKVPFSLVPRSARLESQDY